jgi:hypothetical protein
MKIKIKPIPAIVVGVTCLAVVTSVTAYAINKGKNTNENTVGVSVEQKKLNNTTDTNTTSAAITTVEIQFENCAVLTGTQLKVTALVTPADTDKALIWSSSNENVFTVDADGVVTVKGEGTSVLTATVGTISDAVVIEGITSVASGSKNGFPIYTGITASANTTGGSTGSSGMTGSGKSAIGSTGDSNSNTTTGDSGNGGNPSGNQGGTSGGSGDGGGRGDGGGGGGTPSPSSPDGGGTGPSSTQVAPDLIGIGFSQIMSNVYQYEDGGTYYGEIIIQPNVAIIYIKLRSGAFDAKIQTVLAELLPGESAQVWSNYLSASSDRTFTANGRKVRIVVATNGGHSQIVIYN